MKESKHITIKIAEQTFALANPKESAETLKEIELNFNKIWAKWSTDFPNQSPQEVLAMVAFQYARYYYNMRNELNANEEAIIEFEKHLDEILLNVN